MYVFRFLHKLRHSTPVGLPRNSTCPSEKPPTPRGLRSHCSRPGKTQASPPPRCCGATATRLSDRRSPPFKPHAGVHAPPRRLLSSWRAAGPARHAADTQKRRARDICRGEGNPSRSFAPHAPTGTRPCPSGPPVCLYEYHSSFGMFAFSSYFKFFLFGSLNLSTTCSYIMRLLFW